VHFDICRAAGFHPSTCKDRPLRPYGDRVKLAGDRRLWQQMQDIRVDIDRISGDVDSGNFDVRDIRNRMQRSDTDLLRVQAQLDYKSKGGGGFYRPN
jgi:hypothetical protein